MKTSSQKFDDILGVLLNRVAVQAVLEDMVNEGRADHPAFEELQRELQELKEQTPLIRCSCGAWIPRTMYLSASQLKKPLHKKGGCFLCADSGILPEQKARYADIVKLLMRGAK